VRIKNLIVKSKSYNNACKKCDNLVLKPFLSFMLSFQLNKVHNLLVLMLDPQYKGMGMVIQHVGKQKALQIVSKC
jgi:hypothetical protein